MACAEMMIWREEVGSDDMDSLWFGVREQEVVGGTSSKDTSVFLSCSGKIYATQSHQRPAGLIFCNMVNSEALFSRKEQLCTMNSQVVYEVEEENALG